jgi:DNA-binding NtrC family response regulator
MTDSAASMPRILVVDDEESLCTFLKLMLTREGYRVTTCVSAQQALAQLEQDGVDLVFTDLMMPEMNGLEFIRRMRDIRADTPCVVMTAYASVDSAIEALKLGAADYITKPFNLDEVKIIVRQLLSRRQIEAENLRLRGELGRAATLDRFIGASSTVTQLKELVTRAAATDSTVLLRGESGTGKELLARALHVLSPRQAAPFVSLNCAALPDTLLESELFGHVKGSFTGAVRDKEGLLLSASGGTFFLDEIGEASPAIQVKVLKALEEKIITPVGSTQPVEVDVRLVAATNVDLEAMVKEGRFRPDLFYRLNVIPIQIPPLRDRKDDIPLLVDHFRARIAERTHSEPKQINQEAMAALLSYSWPGNVRELEHMLERAILFAKGKRVSAADFPDKLRANTPQPVAYDERAATPTLETIEKAYIAWVLQQTGGQKSKAASILGIDSSTLYRKIDRYGLKR